MLAVLTKQHHSFINSYYGDSVEAMRVAGYVDTSNALKRKGDKLLKEPLIVEAIRSRGLYVQDQNKKIADRQEIEEFYTGIMRNDSSKLNIMATLDGKTGATVPPDRNIPLPYRIKASELLGKAQALFIDKLDVTQNLTLSEVIQMAYQIENEGTQLDGTLLSLEATALEKLKQKKIERGQLEAEEEATLLNTPGLTQEDLI